MFVQFQRVFGNNNTKSTKLKYPTITRIYEIVVCRNVTKLRYIQNPSPPVGHAII